jgi:hypothetical protein
VGGGLLAALGATLRGLFDTSRKARFFALSSSFAAVLVDCKEEGLEGVFLETAILAARFVLE